MAFYQILYWKDIPAQVRVFVEGRRTQSRPMSERFQQEIDARAMREGILGSDEYLQHWQWSEKRERDVPAEELLDAVARELEQEHAGSRGAPPPTG